MKLKGAVLIILGVLGIIFVYNFDILMGKAANDITGPKSIIAFIICVIFILLGTSFLLKKPKAQ